MNYFLTPTGLKPTGMSVPNLYLYLLEGHLWMSDKEALKLLGLMVQMPHLLFKEKNYVFDQMQKDYDAVKHSLFYTTMEHLTKDDERSQYVIIEKLLSDYSGDCAKTLYLPAENLTGVFRKQILDELILTL